MTCRWTRRRWLTVVLAGAVGGAASSAAAGPFEPGGRRTRQLQVKLLTPLHSAKSKYGDPFDGVVVKDATKLLMGGEQPVPAGTPVKGTVLYAKPGGALKSVGVLTLLLTDVDGTPVDSSREHRSANPDKPSGSEDLALPAGTLLMFNVQASPGGRRRGGR